MIFFISKDKVFYYRQNQLYKISIDYIQYNNKIKLQQHPCLKLMRFIKQIAPIKWPLILALILILTIEQVKALANQQFTYNINDLNIIPYLQEMDLSSSVITNYNEYLDEGKIHINQTFQQIAQNNSASNVSLITYNILYFNLENEQGRQCYFNYFNSSQSFPDGQQYNKQCQNNTNINRQNDDNISCINFTNCVSQTFTYQVDLYSIEYKQNIIMILNNHYTNLVDKSPLYLRMKTQINLQNSNQWFYWSVALTCFLLISLVLLTGVVLYWSLNFRKAHRLLEQLKLTQVDNEVGDLSTSLRKSFMKQE